MTTLAHLDPEAQEAVTLPTEERVQFAKQDNWIGYTLADKYFGTLDDMLAHPKSIRMPCSLLVGRSDNGKTTLFKEYVLHRHPAIHLPDGELQIPVLYVDMASKPTESNFWSSVLENLPISFRDSDPAQAKQRQAEDLIDYVKVRMILIDQINHITQLSGREQRTVLAAIRNLSTRRQIPIAAGGTREAISAMHTDPQLCSRFEVFPLPLWRINNTVEFMEYLQFLISCEKFLPLAEPSKLGERDGLKVALKIHALSGGTVGGIVKVLKKAAVHAIRTNRERIDESVLEGVNSLALQDYQSQSADI